jgi:hypothetical protein
MRNFKIPDKFPKPIINESLDRPSLSGKGDLLKDEDKKIVNKNDPRNKYVRPKDIADNSYLSYGEDNDDDEEEGLDEDNYMLTDEEIEKIAQEKERDLSFKKQSESEWAENHPEVKSVISGEVVHSNGNGLPEDLNDDEGVAVLNGEEFDVKLSSRSMRSGAGPDFNEERWANKKKYPHDNLKTELPSKKERRSRGLLRGLFKN